MSAPCLMMGGTPNIATADALEDWMCPVGEAGTVSGGIGFEDLASCLWPIGGYISDLRFHRQSNTGASEINQLTIGESDGVEDTLADLQALIGNLDNTAISGVNEFTRIDDEMLVRASFEAVNYNADDFWWSYKFWPDSPDHYPLMANSNGLDLDDTNTDYIAPAGVAQQGTSADAIGGSISISTPGTIKLLKVWLENATGGGKDYTFTAMKASGVGAYAAQTLTVTATAAGVTSDTSNSFTVAAGDRITFRVVPAGTPTTGQWKVSCIFVPDTPGYQIVPIAGMQSILNTSVTEMPVWANRDMNTTSAGQSQVGASIENNSQARIINAWVWQETSPGFGDAFRYEYDLETSGGAHLRVSAPDAGNASGVPAGSGLITQDVFLIWEVTPFAKIKSPAATRMMGSVTICNSAPRVWLHGLLNLLGGNIAPG